MRLGRHEKTVLEALARAPELLPDYFRANPGLREGISERIDDREREQFGAGRMVPTSYVRWRLPDVHMSTLSRTLKRLERKGLVWRQEFEGDFLGGSDGYGTYTRFLTLTAEGEEIAETLTNA